MEPVRCQLCGADDAEILFEGSDYWYHGPGKFLVQQCRVCRLIYLSPRPDQTEIGQYYPESYAPYSMAIDDEPSLWRRLNRRYGMYKRVQFIKKRVKKTGKVLDVGCATGNFLDALRRDGWEVYGVEPNPSAAAYAQTRLGIDVFTGQLQEAKYPDHFFDLIILWDVLEHVHDPRQLLLEAARITQPGGILVVTLPNPDSYEAKIFGPFWAGWDVPRHLQIFSIPVINRFLSETKWDMFEIQCLTGRMWLVSLSLQHWLKDKVANKQLRQLISNLTYSAPVRILTLPLFAIIERLKKGSVMAVIAKRV